MAPRTDMAPQPTTPEPTAPSVASPRTRRSLLAGALGGAGALLASAIGRVNPVRAAAGDTLKLGQANDSGTSQTVLLNNGLGAAFTLKTTNVSTGATGIFGWSSQTGAKATRGVYGLANGAHANGVHARNTGAAGTGAALYAEGNNNAAIRASGTVAVSGLASGAVETDVTTYGYYRAAGEFAGANGLIGAVPASAPSDGYGVTGVAPGTDGRGVFGYALASTGTTYGVYGLSESSGGYGVYGNSTSSTGVAGNSASGAGVAGNSA
ncbi:MAG: hypothetical protein ABI598_07075, partial [Chloroflexota bacterium]